jgi:hypothetical protein
MRVRGFNGIVYNDGVSPGLYHARSVGFMDFWRKFNGVASYPFNQWYDAYAFLEEDGVISGDNVQCFSGYGGMALSGQRLGLPFHFKSKTTIQLTQNFRFWGGDWVLPWWSEGALKATQSLLVNKKYKGRHSAILSALRDDVSHVKKVTLSDQILRGYLTLDDSVVANMQKDYDNSWYGRHVPFNMSGDMRGYREHWTHYCAASLCEYLLYIGYGISI